MIKGESEGPETITAHLTHVQKTEIETDSHLWKQTWSKEQCKIQASRFVNDQLKARRDANADRKQYAKLKRCSHHGETVELRCVSRLRHLFEDADTVELRWRRDPGEPAPVNTASSSAVERRPSLHGALTNASAASPLAPLPSSLFVIVILSGIIAALVFRIHRFACVAHQIDGLITANWWTRPSFITEITNEPLRVRSSRRSRWH